MSTGGTRAAVAGPSTPAPRQPPRRKAVPENWDDDFEFAFPVKAKAAAARTVTIKPQGLGLGLAESSRSYDNAVTASSKRSDSPDSFDEDWDEPEHIIAGPSRSQSGLVFPSSSSSVMTTRSNSRSSRVNGGAAPTLLSLPRSSPSQSPTLPSPPASATSGASRRGHSAKTSAATMSSLRSAIGEGGGTPLRGIRKRSSASILKSESGGSLSLHSASPAHKSSPSLVDPTVTPTPTPAGRIRRSSLLPRAASPTKAVRPSPPKLASKSASKSPAMPPAKQPPMPQPAAAQTPVKQQQQPASSELRSTPSSEQLKKPNFWKRLSGGASKSPAVTPPRRQRSSSMGHKPGLSTDPDTPPVPPLPANLRTPSSGSEWSSASGISSNLSSTSTSGSASKPGPVKRLSAVLRRSSGNLSKHKTPSPPHPPLPQPLHPYAIRNAYASASSINMAQASGSSVHMPMPSMSTTSIGLGTPSPATRLRSSGSRSSLVPSNASMTHLSSVNGSTTRLAASSNGSTVKLASSNGSTVKLAPSHNGSSSNLAHTPVTRHRTTSRPSPVALPNDVEPAPRTKFSPGFHLPNNAIGSPYRERAMAAPAHASPLAQDGSDSDTETEENGGATPRRRKIRPVSAQPTKTANGIANGRFKEINASVPVLPTPTSHPSVSSTSSQEPSTLGLSPTTTMTSQTGSVASSHFGHTTLRRITSFSKKHSRRLSGGWKFGSVSSQSSVESKEAPPMAGVRQTLEPVAGSPSKPWDATSETKDSKTAADASAAISKTLAALEARPKAAADAPTEPPADKDTAVADKDQRDAVAPKARPKSKGKGKAPVEKWDDWDEEPSVPNGQRRPRQHRRMSLSEFVIPDTVLAKQKELKRGIGAVKKFAGGVESLKGLVESHEKVCNYILAGGSQSETKMFVSLENEYAQWWEMATVLIEVASTGTDGKESPDPEPRTRRITLATDDARAASEALRQVSVSSSTNTSTSARSSEYPDVFLAPTGGPPKASPPPDYYRASTGRHDLSKRQLEVLRTMLRTPVEASESVVPSVEKRQTAFMSKRPKHQSMPPPAPATIHETPAPRKTHEPSPDNLGSYIMPSPTYPSPNTAAVLAQPHPRHHKLGLAGLRDFLRSLKTRPSQPAPPVTPSKSSRSNAPTGLPSKPALKPRPPPINTETAGKMRPPPLPTSPTTGSTDYASRRSGRFSPDKLGSRRHSPEKPEGKRRRPSIKNLFRSGSGTWTDLVRSPTSPHAPVNNLSKTSLVPQSTDDAEPMPPTPTPKAGTSHGQITGLPRPPSVPALARLKSGKSDSYASLSVDSPAASPTKSRSQEATAFPITAGDGEATLRFKSRMRGLGHPSESSPSRTSSSPAQVHGAPSSELAPGGLDEAPRSRSDAGPRGGDDIVVALTPENLPVLLDYVRQCERRLDEWRQRAGSAGMLGVTV